MTTPPNLEQVTHDGAISESQSETYADNLVRQATLMLDISQALIGGETLREMLTVCTAALVRYLDAAFARIWTLNAQTQVLELQASSGLYTHLDGGHARVPVGTLKIGRIAAKRKPYLTNAVRDDQEISDQEWAQREGMIAFAGYPLVVGERLIGVMALFARQELSAAALQAMAAVANSIALGIERIHMQEERAQLLRREQEAHIEEAELAHQRLFDVFQQAPACICVLHGPEHVYELANPPYLQLVGQRTLLGKPIREAVPELEGQGFYEIMDQVYTTGQPFIGMEIKAHLDRDNDGHLEEGYFNFVCQPTRNREGEIDGVLVHAIEVTEQVQGRQHLQESEERFRVMAESMPQKIFTAKPNGDVDYFNPQWVEFTGLSFEDIRDWGWAQFIHPDDIEENIRLWKHAIQTGEPFSCEHRFRRADGIYRWHVSRAIPMRDAQKCITRWVGSNTDIEDQKRLEEQKDEFISVVSHDLRTPLTVMKGNLQLAERRVKHLLSASELPLEPTKQALRELSLLHTRALRQTEMQNRLIGDLLDVSRIQEKKLDLSLALWDLGALVQDIVQDIQSSNPQRPISLDLPLTEEPLFVLADMDRIGQVVSNYLTNALKYSPAPIAVGVALTANTVRVWVRDQGSGLTHKQQQRIWERFYQVPSIAVQSGTGQGLGLGLYICQALITRHNGTVGVESTPGQGSTFWFTLPLAAATGQE